MMDFICTMVGSIACVLLLVAAQRDTGRSRRNALIALAATCALLATSRAAHWGGSREHVNRLLELGDAMGNFAAIGAIASGFWLVKVSGANAQKTQH